MAALETIRTAAQSIASDPNATPDFVETYMGYVSKLSQPQIAFLARRDGFTTVADAVRLLQQAAKYQG